MLYKSGGVELGICCIRKNYIFSKNGGKNAALKFSMRLFRVTLVLLIFSMLSSAVNSFLMAISEAESTVNFNQSTYLIGLNSVCYMSIIYILNLYDRFMTKVINRDDPFSNVNLLVMMIIFLMIQREALMLFFDLYRITDYQYWIDMSVVRCTFTSVELLFVFIPIRHNYALHHIEI